MAVSQPKIPLKIDLNDCKFLGSGAEGDVYLLRTDDEVLAFKSVKVRRDDEMARVQKEFDLLKRLGECKYFIQAYKIMRLTAEDRVLIFMEYMPGGNLKEFIKKSPGGHLSEAKTTNFTRQLLSGVEFMHAKRIMNRDIKTENVLLDQPQERLKISDFGSGKLLSTARTHTRSHCGTPLYMAPEFMRRRYSRKAELWSVGIILVEMLTGHPPYHKLDYFQFVYVIGNNEFKYDLPNYTSQGMRDLVAQLLALDPDARLSATQALEHELFKRTHDEAQQNVGENSSSFTDDTDFTMKMALDNQLRINADGAQTGSGPTITMDADSTSQVAENLDPHKFVPNEFDLNKCSIIGRGGFGTIYLLKTSHCDLAVKMITKMEDEEYGEVQREFDLLQTLGKSKYFVKNYELRRIDPNQYLIFMEYMPGGTLRNLIRESPDGRLSELKATGFTRQLLRGLQFMHARYIMNRDIKPHNIFLNLARTHLKIGDFGLGMAMSTARSNPTTQQSWCGTPHYMAPELHQGQYGRKAELWSAGIILVEMLMGNPPSYQLDYSQFKLPIGQNKFKYDLPDDTSQHVRSLVAQLLSMNPETRPSATQALKHDVFHYNVQYAREKLSNDDLDQILNTALDNQSVIYAIAPQSGVYYIPDLEKIIAVNDERLSEHTFPVTTLSAAISKDISKNHVIIASNAINSFLTMAKREEYHSTDTALLNVHIIVSQLHIEAFQNADYNVASGDGKVKISWLYFYFKGRLDPLPFAEIVKHIAANLEVTSHLSFSFSPVQPFVCLSEALKEMDGGLSELELKSIDLRGEQGLPVTLKYMELGSLTISNTGIGQDALVSVSLELKDKLERLVIHNEPCLRSRVTCERLFNALKSSSIRHLSLTQNELNSEHLSALSGLLPTMKELCELELNRFEGCEEFIQQLGYSVGSKIASNVKIQ